MERKQWFHGSPSGVPRYDPTLDLVELVAHNFSWESLKGGWTLLDRHSQYFT
jgi:hypothetical protein